jgi:hypothetical protein
MFLVPKKVKGEKVDKTKTKPEDKTALKESLLWGIASLNDSNFEAGVSFVKKVAAFLEENKGELIE